MEKVIYTEAMARVSANAQYFADSGHEAPRTQAWFEGQPDQGVVTENNLSYPFDCPALFYQFEPTQYLKNTGLRAEAEGVLVVHVVQSKTGKDGRELAATAADFEKLLEYVGLLLDVLDGYRLPCSARLVHSGTERDHVNRPLLVERVSFRWSGQRRISTIS
jgi:hypothetical protein